MQHASTVPLHEIERVLSLPRFATYVNAADGDIPRALELFAWNARVSSALMLPAHFAEVAVRNAVDEALTRVYGPNWPWDHNFERSLPQKLSPSFSPRRELQLTRSRYSTTGKVIADLKFVFWETMFTSRHDQRVWTKHLVSVFPHSETQAVPVLRSAIYSDLHTVRALRNRIAHHEPLLGEDLYAKLAIMERVASRRSTSWSQWAAARSTASSEIATRP